MTGFNTQFSAECISLLNLVMAAQFSLNNICAIKSMILLEMKIPQLSMTEATAARNQNSIGDRIEKKPWEKPGSVGGPVPLWPDETVVCSNCSKVSNIMKQMHIDGSSVLQNVNKCSLYLCKRKYCKTFEY